MTPEKYESYLSHIYRYVLEYAPTVLIAVTIFFVGIKLINALGRLLTKAFDKSDLDETLIPFLKTLIDWSLRVLLFITVAAMLGVETTSFVALLGAAGLAVGLSLQGALTNFAGGILVLVLKPYKKGDMVKILDYMGVIKEVQMFNTILISPQNKTIIMPNGEIMNSNIINYSKNDKIRVDLTIGISYSSDLKLAKEILLKEIEKIHLVLKTPVPKVGSMNLGDSSVDMSIWVWCLPKNYWLVQFEVIENCKLALDAADITIPFPQRDVHLYDESK